MVGQGACCAQDRDVGHHDWCGQSNSFRHDAPDEASTTDPQILVDEMTRVPASIGGEASFDGIPIYNVSVVDEHYRLVHPPTQVDFS